MGLTERARIVNGVVSHLTQYSAYLPAAAQLAETMVALLMQKTNQFVLGGLLQVRSRGIGRPGMEDCDPVNLAVELSVASASFGQPAMQAIQICRLHFDQPFATARQFLRGLASAWMAVTFGSCL